MNVAIPDKKLRVAIIGAGLGGLALALALQKNMPDIELDIYERAKQLAEVGAGLGASPRVWAILQSLGLEKDLLEAGGTTQVSGTMPLRFLKGDQPEVAEICEFGSPVRTFHRAHIQQIFTRHLKNSEQILHFSKLLVGYAEPEDPTAPIVLRFGDGSTATCDLVLGADGLKSAVRHQMYNDMADVAEKKGDLDIAAKLRDVIPPVWSGMVAYRAVVPTDKLTQDVKDLTKPMMNILFGKSRYLIYFPISRGQAYNVAAMVQMPGAAGTQYNGPPLTAEGILKLYTDWDPKIKSIISHMSMPLDWAVHTVKDLPTYVKGRVALLGDAAHAMTTSQGSGAGQAIEDGYILSAVLAHPLVTSQNISVALEIYDTVRRPFSQDIARRSRESTRLYLLDRLGWENLQPIGRMIEDDMGWVHATRIEHDEERAMQMVQERLSAQA
ncbi:FAD/NAD-P-binding domain-containing protein [Epithele typhae]|uniref:FAD/NAD-P-binding domain-containing protein n=1 Tax=Epithele typhae TaxID=378194 RepID=UPI0020073E25|nr:FAD/NAD-P-binding domain-containing protein [Epithele typhae]KAH9939003.1 FAD/NAD-P-binding domain-containing protein [Epithele typhae]